MIKDTTKQKLIKDTNDYFNGGTDNTELSSFFDGIIESEMANMKSLGVKVTREEVVAGIKDNYQKIVLNDQ